MALEVVDILVQTDDIVPVPVDGVSVFVYDSTGTTLITSGVTGTPVGHVQFMLSGGSSSIDYQLRFFVNGGTIKSPQLIEVFSPPAGSPTGTNNFVVTASLFVLPVAPNTRMCRCSGFVRDASGRPLPGLDMHFLPQFNPLIVDGIAVMGEQVDVRTNKDGYVEFDLYRFGKYQAVVESHENIVRIVAVPNRSSMNIHYMLFPVVVSVSFSPTPSTVGVGATFTTVPTIIASDFETLTGTALQDVIYTISDPSKAAVTADTNNVYITGVSPGVTNLTVTRKDLSIVYIPDAGISGGVVPLTIL